MRHEAKWLRVPHERSWAAEAHRTDWMAIIRARRAPARTQPWIRIRLKRAEAATFSRAREDKPWLRQRCLSGKLATRGRIAATRDTVLP